MGRRSRESRGNQPRRPRSSRYRGRIVAPQRPWWTTRGPSAAVAHVGVRCRSLEQSCGTARSASAAASRASTHRVPAVVADAKGHHCFGWVGGCRRLDGRSCGVAVFTWWHRRAEPTSRGSGARPCRRSQEASHEGEIDTFTVGTQQDNARIGTAPRPAPLRRLLAARQPQRPCRRMRHQPYGRPDRSTDANSDRGPDCNADGRANGSPTATRRLRVRRHRPQHLQHPPPHQPPSAVRRQCRAICSVECWLPAVC